MVHFFCCIMITPCSLQILTSPGQVKTELSVFCGCIDCMEHGSSRSVRIRSCKSLPRRFRIFYSEEKVVTSSTIENVGLSTFGQHFYTRGARLCRVPQSKSVPRFMPCAVSHCRSVPFAPKPTPAALRCSKCLMIITNDWVQRQSIMVNHV